MGKCGGFFFWIFISYTHTIDGNGVKNTLVTNGHLLY
jgi:hypothetical protein